ncbi:hypothetical protein V501_08965 [Pseudogymnoascus sp. VKM F-4519 (FW-2642)]|nr:hypothetical protein V501_08965 [Pseudogymnoascus sp. VKM F-4519 (FW-2642)]
MSSWSSDKVASKSFMSNYTQIPTIIVGVGEEERKWCALRGRFVEAEEQKVELPDIDSRTFKFIVEWLYSHIVRKPWADTDDARTGLLLDAWVLADYLQMPRLQNAIMELMDTCIFEAVRIPIEEFQRVFGSYDRSSAFRRWMDQLDYSLDDLEDVERDDYRAATIAMRKSELTPFNSEDLAARVKFLNPATFKRIVSGEQHRLHRQRRLHQQRGLHGWRRFARGRGRRHRGASYQTGSFFREAITVDGHLAATPGVRGFSTRRQTQRRNLGLTEGADETSIDVTEAVPSDISDTYLIIQEILRSINVRDSLVADQPFKKIQAMLLLLRRDNRGYASSCDTGCPRICHCAYRCDDEPLDGLRILIEPGGETDEDSGKYELE